MTLPKKNSRSIEIDSLRFRYIVSTSKTDDRASFALNLTVQIESGQGSMLKAKGLITRDFWLDFPNVASQNKYPVIQPTHIVAIIRLTPDSGWAPEENGSPFLFRLERINADHQPSRQP